MAREPGWKHIAYIENLPPLLPSQRLILTGVWVRPRSRSDDVNVPVDSVEDHGEAAACLASVRDKHVAAGWRVSTYQIGDG
jgi:hypothetical protein